MEKRKQAKTKRINIGRLIFGALLILLLLLAGLPAWFPWLVRPVLAHFGLRFDDYQRQGMTKFELIHVRADWKSSHFEAKGVECVLPTTWLWRKLSGHTNRTPDLVIRNGILSFSQRTNAPAGGGKIHSVGATLDEIQKVGFLLRKYIPTARLKDCAIDLPTTRILLPNAAWRQQMLQGQFRSTNWPAPIHLQARLVSPEALRLSLNWPAYHTALKGSFTQTSNQWKWQGELTWQTNRAEVAAQFTNNSWWPAHGRINASQVEVPADLVHLDGYRALTASLALDLVSNQFELQATGFALPTGFARGRGLPPIHARVQLAGDPDSVTLHQLDLQAPFAHATLTNALGIKRSGQLKNLAARLQLSVNLSKLPGIHATGRAQGEVRVEMKNGRQPLAHFNIRGSHIGAFGLKTKGVRVEGDFGWPMLSLDDLTVHLADGSRLKANGAVDLSTKKVEGGHWQFAGGFLNSYLPGFHYQTLEASGMLQGALTNLTQSGQINLTGLAGGVLQPMQLQAQWQAAGWQLSSAKIQLKAGDSTLKANGSFDFSEFKKDGLSGKIQNISLHQADQTLYSLQHPCSISFRPAAANEAAEHWRAKLDSFDWEGENNNEKLALNAQLDWPGQGNVQLKAQHVALGDFTNFVRNTFGDINIKQFGLTANWSNGPVQLSTSADASLTDQAGKVFSVQARLAGGDHLKIDECKLGSQYAPPLVLTGTVPLQIVPAATNHWIVVNDQAPINLEANVNTATNGLMLPLGAHGELKLAQGEVHAHATGTLSRPSVALNLGIGSVRWQTQTNDPPRPRVDEVKLAGTITPEQIQLNQLSFKLDDQPVLASGQWPLPSGFWKTVWSHKKSGGWKLPDWRQATGQLSIQKAQLAAVAHYAPKILAPGGNLSLDLKLAKGGKLGGSLMVTNASTRPLGPLPPVRDFAARVHFDGSQAVLDHCQADLGGQLLELTGQASFPTDGPLSYQAHLTGTNLPLVRRLEFLLRGNVDLTLKGGSDSPTTLSGKVKLRRGLYVRYLSDLLWSGGPKHPAPRPPYFSITNSPFAGWKLGVDIVGDRFLHVQTPVFAGVASADAKLSGTLETPVLTGSARVNSGQIKFPFGTLQVDDGYVALNGNDPRGPDVEFHASGMAYNYDVHLDVTGPANGASVQFSSTPPLNSEEILLLLTAGQIPQNEYNFSTEARAGRLATFLGKDWLGRFTGNVGGKPRWIIKSGEHVSEQGRLTYSVEYRITDRWSIIGEYDQYDEYNANLKWKIISR